MTAERRVKMVQGTRDVLILLGVALLSYGAWLVYRPAGFLVAGALALAGGIRGAR